MEFLVLSSRSQPERERIVMSAVVEAAEALGARRIMKRRARIEGTSVYVKDGEERVLVYRDWLRNWDWKRIYDRIIASTHTSPISRPKHRTIDSFVSEVRMDVG